MWERRARYLAPEIDQEPKQITNLTKYHAIVKLPDNATHRVTMFPPKQIKGRMLEKLKANARRMKGGKRNPGAGNCYRNCHVRECTNPTHVADFPRSQASDLSRS